MVFADHRTPSIELLSGNYISFTKPFKTKDSILKYYYIHLQVEGFCEVLMDGEMRGVATGDLLLYPPGERFFLQVNPNHLHIGQQTTASSFYFLGSLGDKMVDWWNQNKRPQKTKILVDSSLLAIFREISRERRRSVVDQEICDYLMRILCIHIDRAFQQTSSNKPDIEAYLMKDYIERNITEAFKLEDVARHAGLSVSRSVHLFKAVFNKTIMQHALEVRLTMACERIKFSTMTLEQIAESCGFRSYSYFHRVFRAKYGQSPKQYRLQHMENPNTTLQ